MEKESKELLVREFIREKVPDWDNEVVATARFKAFSGQKSDWEPRYLFWRDLILTIAHQFNFIFLKPSEIKNQWFSRGGLAPLCLDHVLVFLSTKMFFFFFFVAIFNSLNFVVVLSYNKYHSIQHLMQIEGDIIRRSDMLDPRGGQLSYLFKKLSNLMGTSKKNPDSLLSDDYIALARVLQVYDLNLLSFFRDMTCKVLP